MIFSFQVKFFTDATYSVRMEYRLERRILMSLFRHQVRLREFRMMPMAPRRVPQIAILPGLHMRNDVSYWYVQLPTHDSSNRMAAN